MIGIGKRPNVEAPLSIGVIVRKRPRNGLRVPEPDFWTGMTSPSSSNEQCGLQQ
jgi:hypothetical protein